MGDIIHDDTFPFFLQSTAHEDTVERKKEEVKKKFDGVDDFMQTTVFINRVIQRVEDGNLNQMLQYFPDEWKPFVGTVIRSRIEKRVYYTHTVAGMTTLTPVRNTVTNDDPEELQKLLLNPEPGLADQIKESLIHAVTERKVNSVFYICMHPKINMHYRPHFLDALRTKDMAIIVILLLAMASREEQLTDAEREELFYGNWSVGVKDFAKWIRKVHDELLLGGNGLDLIQEFIVANKFLFPAQLCVSMIHRGALKNGKPNELHFKAAKEFALSSGLELRAGSRTCVFPGFNPAIAHNFMVEMFLAGVNDAPGTSGPARTAKLRALIGYIRSTPEAHAAFCFPPNSPALFRRFPVSFAMEQENTLPITPKYINKWVRYVHILEIINNHYKGNAPTPTTDNKKKLIRSFLLDLAIRVDLKEMMIPIPCAVPEDKVDFLSTENLLKTREEVSAYREGLNQVVNYNDVYYKDVKFEVDAVNLFSDIMPDDDKYKYDKFFVLVLKDLDPVLRFILRAAQEAKEQADVGLVPDARKAVIERMRANKLVELVDGDRDWISIIP